uniref:NADH-ubiquinone oxidoreductase chain 5 n=1 Tax=Chiridota heheva TaxID=2743191 RepID=A0A8E5JZE0_9ECHN|nr:NADH dehydrogenase subunit 5 [Chiridota heheva]QVD42790.1 NADH dehydrogenase subunit 5 [Chiridota heheva]
MSSFFCFLLVGLFLLQGSAELQVDWVLFSSFSSVIGFTIDFYSVYFFLVAFLVSWSILEFSVYYMKEDPLSVNFYRLLLIFLFNMLLLTCSSSFFLLFIGWEGVGFLSFLLIGWWSTRLEAQSAAIQAIIYNRVGDLGIVLLVFFGLFLFGSWSINITFSMSSGWQLDLLLFSSLLAASGKSAQFFFHPWLPAAMEGPTPVSALLHSSTMVVAGVFLLVRVSSLSCYSLNFSSACIILGGLTSFFAATTAIFQYDIKKIVAYSTTSQLGLMVACIGFGQPFLAFFHICTHAFFKAMLFLCSGSLIHSLGNDQDLRKMGSVSLSMPVTFSCLVIGSVALTGIPFFSGFYSKDLILESISNSSFNFLGVLFLVMATFLTAAYSGRIIYLCSSVNSSVVSVNPISEENYNLTNPIIRLSFGAVLFGWLLTCYFLNLPTFFLLGFVKLLPLVVTIGGLFYSVLFYVNMPLSGLYFKFSNFFSGQWYWNNILHFFSTFLSGSLSSGFGVSLDRGWGESVGPQGVGLFSILLTQTNQAIHLGYLKKYVVIFLLFGLVFLVLL